MLLWWWCMQVCKQAHKQASIHKHTHNHHNYNNNYKQGINNMQDKVFLDFINTTTTRGGSTFNLLTSNVSKQARSTLASTQYKALAKQHINANVVQAYNNNKEFKAKLDQVMQELGITVIA